MTAAEDDRIVEAVLQGEAEAFAHLVRKYQKPIYNLMLRAVGVSDVAADLTQETFIRAYDKLYTFQPGKRFFPWLYTLAVNLARDHARRRRRRPPVAHVDPDTISPEDLAQPGPGEQHRRAEIHSLMETLQRLPVDYREAVILRYRDGLPMKSIAALLGLTTSGAKMRVHRGLAKLRDLWRNDDED
jgi:RNA polymerase sigma-70 factor (ECF subfamily)